MLGRDARSPAPVVLRGFFRGPTRSEEFLKALRAFSVSHGIPMPDEFCGHTQDDPMFRGYLETVVDESVNDDGTEIPLLRMFAVVIAAKQLCDAQEN